ncbi:MAG: hypothetical protein ACR2HM_02505 [Acidimicrobiales bacterium]
MAKGGAKKPAAVEVAAAPGPDLARILPLVGLGVAVWASLPQYSGPKLSVDASKEVADHIIPAVLVLLASVVAILAGRRPQGPGALRLIAGMAVLLAGLWMMATHIPLLLQTMRGGDDAASWAATIYHFSSSLAVFGLGLLWSTVTWAEADDSDQAAKA